MKPPPAALVAECGEAGRDPGCSNTCRPADRHRGSALPAARRQESKSRPPLRQRLAWPLAALLASLLSVCPAVAEGVCRSLPAPLPPVGVDTYDGPAAVGLMARMGIRSAQPIAGLYVVRMGQDKAALLLVVRKGFYCAGPADVPWSVYMGARRGMLLATGWGEPG